MMCHIKHIEPTMAVACHIVLSICIKPLSPEGLIHDDDDAIWCFLVATLALQIPYVHLKDNQDV